MPAVNPDVSNTEIRTAGSLALMVGSPSCVAQRHERRARTTGGCGTVQAHTSALVAVAVGRLCLGAESGERETYRDHVAAFGLASGSRSGLEDVAVAGGLRALGVADGRVMVLAGCGSLHDGLDGLRVLDAATGDEKESIEAGLDVDRAQGELADLFVYEELVVAVRQDSRVRPFSVYARE